jgi:predicted nucleic acid-binding protein
MVTALVDTAVVVDVLRGYAPAVSWLGQQAELGVSVVVWMEIIEGATDRQSEHRAVHLLDRFERINVTVQDMDWSLHQLLRFHLSHGLDAMDCLIASSSFRLNIPLYTHNMKHFTPLIGPLSQKPY